MISRSNMSANIHFEAVRRIKVIKTGKVEDQTIYFKNVIQTPTVVTNAIMASVDPFQAYRDYVLELCEDYEEPIYAEDDEFCLEDPIGVEIRNDGPEHVKRFDDWLKSVEEAGYSVETVAL